MSTLHLRVDSKVKGFGKITVRGRLPVQGLIAFIVTKEATSADTDGMSRPIPSDSTGEPPNCRVPEQRRHLGELASAHSVSTGAPVYSWPSGRAAERAAALDGMVGESPPIVWRLVVPWRPIRNIACKSPRNAEAAKVQPCTSASSIEVRL